MKFIKRILLMITIMAMLVVTAGFYAVKVEPYRLVVKKYNLGTEDGANVRIVQVSDIQISESYDEDQLKKLVKKINQQKPDVFIFTGDLYENYAEYGPEAAVIKELSNLQASYGKYAIWGNRDYGGGCKPHYEDIMTQSGFLILKNDGITMELDGGKQLYLAGLDDYLLGDQDEKKIISQLSNEDDYRILLTHEPDTADKYADIGFPLILSGHSHGGQVRIPFMKVYTTSMAEKYIRGFYTLGENHQTKLYVNQGIGTSHYAIRFGVPPEISVFDIEL